MCFAAPTRVTLGSLVSLDKVGRSVGTETDVNSSFCSEEKKNVIEICTAEQMNEASSFSNGFASTSQEHFQFWVIERPLLFGKYFSWKREQNENFSKNDDTKCGK